MFAVLTMVIPALSAWKPSADIQLILGNYTNVLSALGASLAAGSGLKVHKSLKSLHDKHDAAYAELQATIEKLHEKIDRLEERSEQADGKTQ
ncbi:hypothetical protein RU97_GL001289 [Enterococcus canis]|uniref:Uncharacterized protein n=1 Tax=Enterococcus canis TaxID=214095 RepID=A0A1L8RIY7_9ENTE|nr:hypothetical protein RU97_GL001289 [Enterococcus canis]